MNPELFCCDPYKKDCNTIKPSSYKYPYRLLFISVDGSILLRMRSKLLDEQLHCQHSLFVIAISTHSWRTYFCQLRYLLFNLLCFLYMSYFILINGTFSYYNYRINGFHLMKTLKKQEMRLHKGFDLILYFDWEKIKDLQNAFRYFLQERLYAKLQNKQPLFVCC